MSWNPLQQHQWERENPYYVVGTLGRWLGTVILELSYSHWEVSEIKNLRQRDWLLCIGTGNKYRMLIKLCLYLHSSNYSICTENEYRMYRVCASNGCVTMTRMKEVMCTMSCPIDPNWVAASNIVCGLCYRLLLQPSGELYQNISYTVRCTATQYTRLRTATWWPISIISETGSVWTLDGRSSNVVQISDYQHT